MPEKEEIKHLYEKFKTDIPKIVEGFITELPKLTHEDIVHGKILFGYSNLATELHKRVDKYLTSQWLNARHARPEEAIKVYGEITIRYGVEDSGRLWIDAHTLAADLLDKWILKRLSESKQVSKT